MSRHRLHPASPGLRIPSFALAGTLAIAGPAHAQLDICGCIGDPTSHGLFDSADPNTWPPGTTQASNVVTIPLPADGVLVFDEFVVDSVPGFGNGIVRFLRNDANSTVTLLVAGDMVIDTSDQLNVNGTNGGNATTGAAGIGGLGGPGGFRGGDGAYQNVNFASLGGPGLGPLGGAPGDGAGGLTAAGGALLFSNALLPMTGGGGGGGGGSSDTEIGCSGGGGGGGGGGLLIAANGTVTIDGTLGANGGTRGGNWTAACSGLGGGGGGGAIRIVADTIQGAGSVTATGGTGGGQSGALRLEAFNNTLSANAANPVALRAPAPGPVAPLLAQTVAIIAVNGVTDSQANGQPLSILPQGGYGMTDVLFQTPGLVTVELRTEGVPSGTRVAVTVKPRVGNQVIEASAPLSPAACDGAGICDTSVDIDVPAGAHVIEARATFQP